jgi:hypothetical protein
VSTLARCDIGSVEQAAWALAQCADRTAAATAASQRAGRATWHWRGPAQRSFDASLADLQRRFTQIEAAHEEAAGVIRQYVIALALAADRARTADAMEAEADALSAQFRRAAAAAALPLSGPDPGEAVRARAASLRCEAVDQEAIAASLAAAQLDGLGMRAPHAPRFTGTFRFADDVAQTGLDTVSGTASLLGSAWQSLPGVGNRISRHDARHELVEAGEAAVSVWNIPLEIRDALGDDRPGLAAAAMAGAWGPGKLSKLDRHRTHDVGLAEKEAYREAERRTLLTGRRIWRQSAEEMGRNGVDLINEEARGGHTWEKHVAASRAYLTSRNREGWRRAGTFRDLDSANELVNAVLRAHADSLEAVYTLPANRGLRLTTTFPFTTGRVTVAGSSRTIPAYAVTVVLRLEGGEPVVYTAFPEL